MQYKTPNCIIFFIVFALLIDSGTHFQEGTFRKSVGKDKGGTWMAE